MSETRWARRVGGEERVMFVDGPYVMEIINDGPAHVRYICDSAKEATTLIERERASYEREVTRRG